MVYIRLAIILFIFSFSQHSQKLDVYLYDKVDSTAFAFKFMTSLIELYNVNNADAKIELNFLGTSKFLNLFKEMKDTTNLHSKLAIGAITITTSRLKQYDFSKYLPLKTVLLVPHTSPVTKGNWQTSHFRIGYFKGTSQEELISSLKRTGKYKPVGIPFSNLLDVETKLMNKQFDMMFVEGMEYKSLKHVKRLLIYYDENYNYGIMYPKGSTMKKKLDKYINYYIRSSSYFSQLRESFGVDVGNQLFQFFYRKKVN